LKPVLGLRARSGPTGKIWYDAEFRGRKFVAFQMKNGDLTLYERVGAPVLDHSARRRVGSGASLLASGS
jgi:hypothetical protein